MNQQTLVADEIQHFQTQFKESVQKIVSALKAEYETYGGLDRRIDLEIRAARYSELAEVVSLFECARNSVEQEKSRLLVTSGSGDYSSSTDKTAEAL